MKKSIQYFTPEYLEQCKNMTIEQRLDFLENFRKLNFKNSPSKLISIKIPENLLNAFKSACMANEIKYQTQIKRLMRDWLEPSQPK